MIEPTNRIPESFSVVQLISIAYVLTVFILTSILLRLGLPIEMSIWSIIIVGIIIIIKPFYSMMVKYYPNSVE